jgi:hypothetical protein
MTAPRVVVMSHVMATPNVNRRPVQGAIPHACQGAHKSNMRDTPTQGARRRSHSWTVAVARAHPLDVLVKAATIAESVYVAAYAAAQQSLSGERKVAEAM